MQGSLVTTATYSAASPHPGHSGLPASWLTRQQYGAVLCPLNLSRRPARRPPVDSAETAERGRRVARDAGILGAQVYTLRPVERRIPGSALCRCRLTLVAADGCTHFGIVVAAAAPPVVVGRR